MTAPKVEVMYVIHVTIDGQAQVIGNLGVERGGRGWFVVSTVGDGWSGQARCRSRKQARAACAKMRAEMNAEWAADPFTRGCRASPVPP
jgi:hypothetical protein